MANPLVLNTHLTKLNSYWHTKTITGLLVKRAIVSTWPFTDAPKTVSVRGATTILTELFLSKNINLKDNKYV